VHSTNQKLAQAALPLRVVNLATVWTVLFKMPGRYNWLLQYYLRAEGLTLSWVGTGRCLSSLDFTDEDYQTLQDKLLAAAQKMQGANWWLIADENPGAEKKMRARLVGEILGSLVQVPKPLKSVYTEVMRRKSDDHHASHSNRINQFFHLLSSSVFIYCYFLAFSDLTTSMCLGLLALFVRQFGHAILEPPCHDKEALLLGYTTRNKTLIVLGYLLIPLFQMAQAGAWSAATLSSVMPDIAFHWFLWTLLVVLARLVFLMWKHDVRSSLIWFVKLITDPLTDIIAYFPRRLPSIQA
jgi:glutamate-1-semialdehyde 2,1-aminomutase